jgi:DNA (cytosine-5)-methyltransferase 1
MKARAAFIAAIDNKSSGRRRWRTVGEQPLRTVTLENRFAAAVAVPQAALRRGPTPQRRARGRSRACATCERPMPTVVPTGNGGDLVVSFLAKHNAGHEATGQKLTEPMPAITGATQQGARGVSLVKLRGTCTGQPVTEPLQTVSAQGNHFAEVRAFLMKYHRDGGQWASCKSPMPTVVANDSSRW